MVSVYGTVRLLSVNNPPSVNPSLDVQSVVSILD